MEKIKKIIKSTLKKNGILVSRLSKPQLALEKYTQLYEKYQNYTMVSKKAFINNLKLVAEKLPPSPSGDIVECGVWRGGMIAAISEVIGSHRSYYLYDSFEGLPDAQDIDGLAAKQWQKNTNSKYYHDNCRAEQAYAEKAMQLAHAPHCFFKKGWFEQTIPQAQFSDGISLLRLDADWYDSTMICLKYLYPQIVNKGLIIIDDYYTWEGCAKAVHDYLSTQASTSRVHQFHDTIAYIIKND